MKIMDCPAYLCTSHTVSDLSTPGSASCCKWKCGGSEPASHPVGVRNDSPIHFLGADDVLVRRSESFEIPFSQALTHPSAPHLPAEFI